MKFKVFFLLFYCAASAQLQYVDSLQTIIQSNSIEVQVKQQKIDLFFKKNILKIDSLELAECYHEYGKWFYINSIKNNKEYNLKKAITFTQKALELKENLEVSESQLRKTLYNLGYFHSISGNNYQVIHYCQKIKELATVDKLTLYALGLLSKTYKKMGDYHKALLNSNTQIEVSYIKKEYIERSIRAHIDKAEILSIIGGGKFSKSIKKNLFLADSLLKTVTSKKTFHHYEISQLEANRLLDNGLYKEALPFLEEVLRGVSKKDSLNLTIINSNIGSAYLLLKSNKLAEQHLKKAITYNVAFSATYENLGDLYLDEKEFKKSLKSYQQALNTQFLKEIKGIEETIPLANLEQAKNKYYALHHLIQKAKGWIAYYHHDNDSKKLQYALETFEAADKLIDIIRFESTEYKSKLYWREQGASLYQGAVEVCYLLNQPEKAFYFMEKNKAILLLEDISNHQAIKNANIPLEEAQKEQDLKRKIHSIQNILAVSTTADVTSMERELYLSKRKYATFIDSLIVAYPNYARFKKKIPIISYKDAVGTYAVDNTSVLHYIINKKGGFGLLMNTTKKPLLFKISQTKEFTEKIQEFKKLSAQKITTTQQQQEFAVIANTVFNKIIPTAVFEQVKGQKVILVPDYYLQEISFETLTTTTKPDSFLIKDVELSYAYSLSYLQSNNTLLRTTEKDFLGVAPVSFDTLQLPSLKYSLSEVNAVKEVLSGESLLHNEATKGNFLNIANNYAILHLATHADVNEVHIPWIALNDEKLTLEEVYGYKNQHEIVTLSACETSLGKMQEGEGVLSLARGFFYGGAKSVVSSLWATNDKSNQEIIIDFYKELKSGSSKSTALRQAKLNYLNTHEGVDASPFYWGGLILIGDSESVNLYTSFFSTHSNMLYLGVFLAGILLLIAFKFFKSKTKK